MASVTSNQQPAVQQPVTIPTGIQPKSLVESTPKLKPVIDSVPTVKEKSVVAKIFSKFISSGAKNVKDYLISDVLIPTIKSAIINSVQIALGGKPSSTTLYQSGGGLPITPIRYGSVYSTINQSTPQVQQASVPGVQILEFASKADADIVLENLNGVINTFNRVTINDFYEICNRADLIAPGGAGAAYGWRTLRGTKIAPSNNGFVIQMPCAVLLNSQLK